MGLCLHTLVTLSRKFFAAHAVSQVMKKNMRKQGFQEVVNAAWICVQPDSSRKPAENWDC